MEQELKQKLEEKYLVRDWKQQFNSALFIICGSQIKVMLRMTDNNGSGGGGAASSASNNEFINIDQKRRQITFIESSPATAAASSSVTAVIPGATQAPSPPTAAAAGENANANGDGEQPGEPPLASTSVLDRAPMVSAPKIFAFDSLFTNADPQVSRNLWPPISHRVLIPQT